MRVKTSVTIDEHVLRAIDRAATPGRSRSRILEDAARLFLARQARATRDRRDREILDGAADALNAEMVDVLAFQADL
jgi:metal-responsive CopG/Arc/MetJ family transcriptional regulator